MKPPHFLISEQAKSGLIGIAVWLVIALIGLWAWSKYSDLLVASRERIAANASSGFGGTEAAKMYGRYIGEALRRQIRFVDVGMLVDTREAVAPDYSINVVRYVPVGASFSVRSCMIGSVEVEFDAGEEYVVFRAVDYVESVQSDKGDLPHIRSTRVERDFPSPSCIKLAWYFYQAGFVRG